MYILTMCRTYFSASWGPDNCTRLAMSCNDRVKKVWNLELSQVEANKEIHFIKHVQSSTKSLKICFSLLYKIIFVVKAIEMNEPNGFSHPFSRGVMTSGNVSYMYFPIHLKWHTCKVIHCSTVCDYKRWEPSKCPSIGLVKYSIV